MKAGVSTLLPAPIELKQGKELGQKESLPAGDLLWLSFAAPESSNSGLFLMAIFDYLRREKTYS